MEPAHKKETVSAAGLREILRLLEEGEITYWIDGGWGVDLLAGRQTRPHRDVDLDFDSRQEEKLLGLLIRHGYVPETDQRPVRLELYHPELGWLDIHPFVLNPDGTSRQASPEGGWYEFEADYFGAALWEGKTVPCISLKGQKIFHSGYELREKDLLDLEILRALTEKELP